MEHPDAFVIKIDELQVIELLQHKVAGVVQDICPFVVPRRLQETLERDPIVQILTRMEFKTNVHPVLLKYIENRHPAVSELFKSCLYESARPLRPGINRMPHQGAREAGAGFQAQDRKSVV